jgi:stage IV sporulation protein A
MADIYKDISVRTNGNIYIGVIGPVRTGKSTFIKRFMETVVIPNIQDKHKKARAQDELPQSGAGRTVMTAEPKFIPEEAAEVSLGEANVKVRMVDCVGYMVPSALGQFEDSLPRMVMTPWFDHEIPMTEAAELGTRKVVSEHATIGILVTTDGSIADIPRAEYAEAEERVINELKESGKPFVILVNSRDPEEESVAELCAEIQGKYNVTTIPVNAMTMEEEDIKGILKGILWEFPIRRVDVFMPEWCDSLRPDHWLKTGIFKSITAAADGLKRVRDVKPVAETIGAFGDIASCTLAEVSLSTGTASLDIDIPRALFYKIINEQTGFEMSGDNALLPLLVELSHIRAAYKKVENALKEVEQKGYGIVVPDIDELILEPPQLVKQGGQFGVRLRAKAPSIHMMRADIQTTISPIVGTERQSEELVSYLLKEFEGDELSIWQSKIFGKTLHQLVNEGLANKLSHMPEEARGKLRYTLERIINQGSSGLICIIL